MQFVGARQLKRPALPTNFEDTMKHLLTSAAVATAFSLWLAQPAASQDLASQIVGVWKWTSSTNKEVETGKINHPYGQNPSGQIVYTKGGHVVFALAGDNRKPPPVRSPMPIV